MIYIKNKIKLLLQRNQILYAQTMDLTLVYLNSLHTVIKKIKKREQYAEVNYNAKAIRVLHKRHK